MEQIASHHGVKPEQVLLGCGSCEILHASAMAFLGAGKRLVQASPTYEAMEHYGAVHWNGRCVDSPHPGIGA